MSLERVDVYSVNIRVVYLQILSKSADYLKRIENVNNTHI